MFFIRAKHVSLLFLTLTALITNLSASTAEDDSKAAEERLDSLEARIPELSRRLASTQFPGVKSNVTPSGSMVFGANYQRFSEVSEIFYKDSLSGFVFPERMCLTLNISGENRAALTLGLSLLQAPAPIFTDVLTMIRQSARSHVHVGLDLPEWGAAMISFGNDISLDNSKFSNQVSVSHLTLAKNYGGIKFAWDRLPWMGENEFTLNYDDQIKGKTLEDKREGTGSNGVLLQGYVKPWNLGLLFMHDVKGGGGLESERGNVSAGGRSSDKDTLLMLSGIGNGQSYYKAYAGRLQKNNIASKFSLGATYYTGRVNERILQEMNDDNINIFNVSFRIGSKQRPCFEIKKIISGSDTIFDTLSWGKGFLKENHVFSLDFNGPLGNILSLSTEFALSVVDTTWYKAKALDTTLVYYKKNPIQLKEKYHSYNVAPAVFSVINWSYLIPAKIQLAYVNPGFYSQKSIVNTSDVFYPFGSNLAKPGNFIDGKEHAPYIQNMAGAQITLQPQLFSNGKSQFTYGYHSQIIKGRDILTFPHRLNGMNEQVALLSCWSKWNNGLINKSLFGILYDKRLGDESYFVNSIVQWSNKNRDNTSDSEGPDAGGIRGDYCGIFETFVPYEDSASAKGNYMQTVDSINVFEYSKFVPSHRKGTFNAAVELGFDAGNMLFKKPDKLLLNSFVSIDGISSNFIPLAFGDKSKDIMLWSFYTRIEPMYMVTSDLGIIGLAGWENWRSQKAWMNKGPERNINRSDIQRVPINYQDWALGIGFDWKLLKQIGFFGRFKWFGHEDKEHPVNNNYKAFVVSGKMSFVF